MSHISSTHDDHGTRWRVSRCECGVFHIKLGTVVLEMDHTEFAQLQELLDRAADYFGVTAPASRATARAH